jgi:succinyl-diaminopimelate desuccinylase
MALSDHDLGERLAARTLELIDIPSESRDEARLAEHVRGLLPGARDLGDSCVLAGPEDARVLLGGHFDTVPVQGNRPGRHDGERISGLGASDMKGALAVMIELVRDGLPFGALFFGREELPFTESALTPLLARHPFSPELVVMMEPTDNAIHAGCLGNINATWSFHGVAGHSARPWLADNAIHKAAAGIAALAAHEPEPHDFDGLRFIEVASVTRIAGGIASNVVPDLAEATLNYRYAPGRSPQEAEARLAELCAGLGELRIDGHAPSGAVATRGLVDALIAAGDLVIEPKQAWTPVAEFGSAGLPAINFGPGDPPEAHTRGESISIQALVRGYRVLERFAAEALP